MVKLFIDVITPANGKVYEFRLDGSMSAATAKAHIAGLIVAAEQGAISFSEQLILGDNTSAKRLDDHVSLYGGGVRSGHTLTLA